MNPDIEVLDVLADDLYGDPADIDVIPINFSIHFDSLPVPGVPQRQGHSH